MVSSFGGDKHDMCRRFMSFHLLNDVPRLLSMIAMQLCVGKVSNFFLINFIIFKFNCIIFSYIFILYVLTYKVSGAKF